MDIADSEAPHVYLGIYIHDHMCFEAFDHQRSSAAQIFYGLGAAGGLMLILIDLKIIIGERRKLGGKEGGEAK